LAQVKKFNIFELAAQFYLVARN